MSEILLVNPRRRRATTKRRRTTATRRRRRRNPVANPRRRRRPAARRIVRRRRRNPSGRGMKGVQRQVMGAVPGAVGALALDVLLGYVPIPANLKAGPLGYVTKAVGAIGIGILGKNVTSAANANAMAQGALTVILHTAMRNTLSQFAPGIQMGAYVGYDGLDGLGYAGSGWNPDSDVLDPDALGTYLPSLSSEQMTTDEFGLGEYLNAGGELPGDY